MDVALATAVAPTTMAAARTLPVAGPLEPLLPEGALVRGRTLGCSGLAAPSLALALAAEACRDGAWLALVDLPWLGIEAAVELGVPPERVVRVDAGQDERGELWGEVLAATLDGFELVLTRVPARVPAGLARRLQTRLRTRGGVLVVIGDPGPLSVDVGVAAEAVRWDGLGTGHGHLRARRVSATASGRRVPRPRRAHLWLPAADGGLATAMPEPTVLHPRSPHPDEQPATEQPATVGAGAALTPVG